MSGRVGNECNRALCGFASHGQFGIWLGVPVALGLITPSFALPQQLPPGISHYEVEILEGMPFSHSESNAAFDISDCGLAVGRQTQVGPNGVVTRAFLWSQAGQFGFTPRTQIPLPCVTLESCSAFDISEFGVAVGVIGNTADDSNASLYPRWGAIWRCVGSGVVELQQLDGPPGWHPNFDPIIEAVAANPPLRAIGFSRVPRNCGPAVGGPARRSAFMVDPGTPGITPPVYWTEADATEYEPAPANRRGYGISPNGALLVGSSPVCPLEAPYCQLVSNAMVWRPSTSGTALLPETIDAILTGEPSPQVATSEVESVTDDGVAAGYVIDNDNGCLRRAFAWNAVETSGSGSWLPLGQEVFTSSLADDIEPALWSPGHIAVGAGLRTVDERLSGLVWFHAAESPWSASGWSWIDANDAVSPLYGAAVGRLRGVNRWGDCVGSAMISGVTRPVLLRAVRCQGDIDHSGAVDAADIALLLGLWGCEHSDCPNPAVDLSVDGLVNAKDLSLLLANWGLATCASAPCSPPQWPVPSDIATYAENSVDFSIHFVGLTDIAGYRAWAATVPAPLREYVDEMIWRAVKGDD